MAEISTEDIEGKITISISGPMDEELSLPFFSDPSCELKIDLQNVNSINSVAIQIWVKWISRLTGKITLSRCPPAIVAQINMIEAFIPENAGIESFYIPLYSEHTDETDRTLIVIDRDFKNGVVSLPEIRDSEGHLMEIDVLPEKYYRFLQRLPR